MARVFLASINELMPITAASLTDHELLQCETTQQAVRLLLVENIDLFVICVHFDDSRAMELVKQIRLDKRHKKTPILITQILRTEMSSFIQQTMDVMKSLGVINEYLKLESDPDLGKKIQDAVAQMLDGAKDKKSPKRYQ